MASDCVTDSIIHMRIGYFPNFPAGCHKERLEGQVGGAIFQAANVTLAFESERGNMSNFRGERSVDHGAKKSNE
jgi:hypothetical protein